MAEMAAASTARHVIAAMGLFHAYSTARAFSGVVGEPAPILFFLLRLAREPLELLLPVASLENETTWIRIVHFEVRGDEGGHAGEGAGRVRAMPGRVAVDAWSRSTDKSASKG